MVVGDYAFTEVAMRDQFILQIRELESRGLTVPRQIMQPPADNMESWAGDEAYALAVSRPSSFIMEQILIISPHKIEVFSGGKPFSKFP